MTTIVHPTDLLPDPSLIIGAEFVAEASGGWFDHVNPSTGLVQKRMPLAGAQEVDRAVAAARAAFPAWRALEPNLRRDLLLSLAHVSREKGEELARIATMENGTNNAIAQWLCKSHPYEYLTYYGGYVDKIEGDVVPSYPGSQLNYTLPEPYGVVGIIIPWNGPMGSYSMKVMAALAAGNCVVLKPAENAAFTALAYTRWLLDAGLPPGVINVVPGTAEAGEALVRHPGVAKVSFTGGLATARKVAVAAAETAKPLVLELGGKSANVVFADADLDLAAMTTVMWGMTTLNGQACAVPTRLLIEDSVYDEVVERIVAILATLPVGDPFDPEVTFGPMSTEAHFHRVVGAIDQARSEKAGQLVTGGGPVDGDGFFVQPTVFGEVDPGSNLAQREVFGPVLSAMRFTSEDEAVRVANGTSYGLAAYLFTNDLRRAHRVAANLEAGTIGVNSSGGWAPNVAFGGVKESGYGKEGGHGGIEEFLTRKNVNVSLA